MTSKKRDQTRKLIAGVVWPTHQPCQVFLLSDHYRIVNLKNYFVSLWLYLLRTITGFFTHARKFLSGASDRIALLVTKNDFVLSDLTIL